MNETCNLATVNNTPSEARRNTSIVEYYFINFRDKMTPDVVPTWHTLRAVIECIWDLLETDDLYFIGDLYICAYQSDGSVRHVRHIDINQESRHIRISRVE